MIMYRNEDFEAFEVFICITKSTSTIFSEMDRRPGTQAGDLLQVAFLKLHHRRNS